MAMPTDTIIEVQPGVGSDTLCGGGFSNGTRGATGVDYSTLAAAKYTYSADLSGAATTTLTSAGSHFSNDILGNVIQITGQGLYMVTAFTSAAAVTVDRALGTFSAATGYVGGAFASIGQAGALGALIGGTPTTTSFPVVYLKATGTAGTAGGGANTAGGRLTPSTNMWVVGYTSNRSLTNTDARPTINAAANGIICIYEGSAAGTLVRNINFNANGFTSCTAVQLDTPNVAVDSCQCTGFLNGFYLSAAAGQILNCEVAGMQATGSPIGIYLASAGQAHGCSVHGWTNTNGIGFQATNNDAHLSRCVAYAGKNIGFYLGSRVSAHQCVACNITGTVGDGFQFGGSSYASSIVNGVATACSTFGFNQASTDALPSFRLTNCAGYNNTSGHTSTHLIANYTNMGFIPLTADPFTSAATGDFTLNNAAGGGALLRGAGWPAAIAGLAPSSAVDVGAYQHAAAAAAALGFPVVGAAPAFIRGRVG